MNVRKIPEGQESCANCGKALSGRYCSFCGEKVLSEKDHSLGHFILEWSELVFHFDSRFLRTIKVLAFKPGFLTVEYWIGRRIKYMRPFQLLILLTVAYFLSSSVAAYWGFHARVMFPTIDDLLNNRVYSHWFTGLVQSKVLAGNIPWQAYPQASNEHLEQLAKSMVILLVPLLAIILQLFYLRTKRSFLDHLVAASHLVSFYVLFWSIFIVAAGGTFRVSALIGHLIQHLGFVGDTPLIVLIGYVFFALRRMYHQPLLLELLRTLLLVFVGIQVITQVYDYVLFWASYVIT